MIGPGKYTDLCESLRKQWNADGVMMIVVGGELGHGSACNVEQGLAAKLPNMLRAIADDMEKDHARLAKQARKKFKTDAEYIAAIEHIAKLALEWRTQNPGREVLVEFRFPQDIMVSACISDALQHGLVRTNDAGLEMLKAISNWGARDEATVLMIQVALEPKT